MARIKNSELYQRHIALKADVHELVVTTRQLESTIRLHNHALGRIIAKLDPAYGKDEYDPLVKAESNAIGEPILHRLEAELNAARKVAGQP